jgi:hypothetical protein
MTTYPGAGGQTMTIGSRQVLDDVSLSLALHGPRSCLSLM